MKMRVRTTSASAEPGLGQRPLDDREDRPGLGPRVAWVRDMPSGPASVVPLTQHRSPIAIARL